MLKYNGHVAHRSLEGLVEAKHFVDGEVCRADVSVLDILDEPNGTRERQLLLGDVFVVLDNSGNYAFGYAERDGYVGWVHKHSLTKGDDRTHKVIVARSIAIDSSDVKKSGHELVLSHGSRVQLRRQEGDWSAVRLMTAHIGISKWVRSSHLVPVDHTEVCPVTVAERFLGTPYLWGGNSAFGIDCSGLVQAACLACGIPCPGDSDMQQDGLGEFLPHDAPLWQGDLLFWKGHVAWVFDANTLLHANAYHMAVAFEPLQQAITRIEAQGDGPVTARKRLGGQ